MTAKEFKLNIHLGNDCFEDIPGIMVARILREIADKIMLDGADLPTMNQTIRDVNGNDVGRYSAK